MRMNRHDDSQRSGRLVTQPAAAYPPPSNSLYEKQLTAPADRPQGDPAVAVATVVAIGSDGYVHRRTGMRAARALPGDRNVPDPRLLTAGKTHAALPANQIRCFADHHSMVAHHPVWGYDPDAHVRGAVGACIMGRTCGSHLVSPTGPRQTASVRHLSGHPAVQQRGCKMILKEPHARAA